MSFRLPLLPMLAAALWLATILPATLAHARDTAPKASACRDDSGWDDPARPFQLYGNTWYVGTCGISVLLITSPQGHILIDSGTVAGSRQVLANLRTLGFSPKDVRAIVISHEHFDHIGGLAGLQRATGAPVLARGPAARSLRQGRSGRDDPQFLNLQPFAPVAQVRRLGDEEAVHVGPLLLQPIPTPGHSPGASSWTWRSCQGDDCRQLVYADSLSAVSDSKYRFSDDQAHPGYVAAFRQSLDRLAALHCDILITPHPSSGDLWSRVGDHPSRPLVDTTACRTHAHNSRARLEQRLAEEASPAATASPRP